MSSQPTIGNADHPQDLYLVHGAELVGAGGGRGNRGLVPAARQPALARLALDGVGGGEQGEVEGPAADVAVHVQRAAGVAGGVACLVEAGEPGRVVLAGGAVKGLLGSGEGGTAPKTVTASANALGRHRDRPAQWVRSRHT
jgi:hypothetical protein